VSGAGGTQFFWLASRSVGVIAIVLVSISVCFGLALAARVGRGPGVAVRVKTLHEALALAGLGAIVLHGALLLGDPYTHPGVSQIVVPFTFEPNPVWTGLGVIAGWLAALVTASFYARRWIGAKNWRKLHRLSFAVYAMGVVHAIGAGSDIGSPWMIVTLAAAAAPVAVLGWIRLSRRQAKSKGPRSTSGSAGVPPRVDAQLAKVASTGRV
jgi:sulfoxide reductase heme-binding subunit YedZ